MKHIRSAIFGLETSPAASGDGLRDRVLASPARRPGRSGSSRGASSTDRSTAASTTTSAAELLATLREALSNVARHAQATHVEVEVVVADHVACG